MRKIHFCLSLALIFTACASTRQTTRSGKSRNVITAEEITNTIAQNAYEVIQSVRPQLLNYRGVEPAVYVDNIKRGGIASLYHIYASDIQEIQYLNPDEATFRYGTGNMGGAFIITSKSY